MSSCWSSVNSLPWITITKRPCRLVYTRYNSITVYRTTHADHSSDLLESQPASQRLQHPQHQSTMSSSSSYGSYGQSKGAYASRPSTSSTCMFSTPIRSSQRHDSNILAAYSAASSSLYTNSGSSSRSKSYKNPPVIHNGGGKINDPNTSTSAPNGGYYN